MNKKILYLSLATVTFLYGDERLEDINIVEKATTQMVQDVSSEEIKSADLAEALERNIPSVSLIRRSGIANDIILRGQTRDNINVIVDGTKTYGACVNRMDPPLSHIVTHTVDSIEVTEGAFDVEDFGSLSGTVKVRTKKPTKKLSGEINANIGSFGYREYSGTISGGTDRFRALITSSTESSNQYRDGDGNNFAEQLDNYTKGRGVEQYNYRDRNMKAYKKNSVMGKIFIDVTDNQELRASYTANRSDDVLYPSSKMDAIYDDSDIANLEYSIKNLGDFSKRLDLQIYNSEVEHPMSTEYRVIGEKNYKTHKLTTQMSGLKIKNSADTFTYGIDSSKRNWDGEYYITNRANGVVKHIGKSIDDVDTKNLGLFLKSKKDLGRVELSWGVRYDDTSIDTHSIERDRDYNSFSANLFAKYKVDKELNLFGGVGKSNRVPDARELYNTKYTKADNKLKRVLNGNPNLDQTKNYEIDLGLEQSFSGGKIKVKTFYSKLEDYIYYNGSRMKNSFENIDAHIYGVELNGDYMVGDDLTLSGKLAYNRGKKDTQPTNQKDKDLANIAPMKINLSAQYDYDDSGDIELSLQNASKWKNIDSDNGEQVLDGYTTLNLKTTREFDNGLIFTAGVDNILDETYTTTNTYKDLILMSNNSDTMLINEAGRYFYLNAKYQF